MEHLASSENSSVIAAVRTIYGGSNPEASRLGGKRPLGHRNTLKGNNGYHHLGHSLGRRKRRPKAPTLAKVTPPEPLLAEAFPRKKRRAAPKPGSTKVKSRTYPCCSRAKQRRQTAQAKKKEK